MLFPEGVSIDGRTGEVSPCTSRYRKTLSDLRGFFHDTQALDALIAEGKPFDMLYLPSRDHFLLNEAYPLQRNWDFMVRHLLGREPPADFRLSVSGR